MPKDATLETERLAEPGESNIQILQVRLLTSPENFSDFGILSIQVLLNTAHGYELLSNYENKYCTTFIYRVVLG